MVSRAFRYNACSRKRPSAATDAAWMRNDDVGFGWFDDQIRDLMVRTLLASVKLDLGGWM
jgi:hypothetical protein